jgi:hypothetical protein
MATDRAPHPSREHLGRHGIVQGRGRLERRCVELLDEQLAVAAGDRGGDFTVIRSACCE